VASVQLRLVVVAGVALVAGAATSTAQQTGGALEPAPSEVAAVTAPTPASEPAADVARFDLGELSGAWPQRFILFKDYWSPDARDVGAGPPTLWGVAQPPVPATPRLVGLESFGVTLRFGEEPGPGQHRRIIFGPMYRSWDDLDGWEKFAVTLQYAGAAAAVAHFASKLVH
jgi:hypothetical protein